MEKNTITSIRYQLIDAINEPRQCVSVYFLFEGKPTERLIYFRKKDSFNYLKEAQKIIEKELANGKLVKYARKYHDTKVHNHLALKIITPVLAIAAFSSAGFYAYEAIVDPHSYKPGEVVQAAIQAEDARGVKHTINLSNPKPVVGKDYTTKILLEDSNGDAYSLPRKLNQVAVISTELEEENYTYDLIKRDEATLTIPAKYVLGPVRIDLTVLPVEYGATMNVLSIEHCDATYLGNLLHEGEVISNIPAGEIKIVCTPKSGYEINKNCFTLKDKAGKDVPFTFEQALGRAEIAVKATDDFSFSVVANKPEDAVAVTIKYNHHCNNVTYGGVPIFSGDKIAVASSQQEIVFGVDVNSTVKNLTASEITCDLEGIDITVNKSLDDPNHYDVSLDLSSCEAVTDFELYIHPATYNSFKLSIGYNEYVTQVTYNGQSISDGEEIEITPTQFVGKSSFSLGITVAENVTLVKNDIVVDGLSADPIIDIKGISPNYVINISADEFTSFTLNINPIEPYMFVQIYSQLIGSHGVASIQGKTLKTKTFTDVIPTRSEDGSYYELVFDVVTDGAVLSDNNVRFSADPTTIESVVIRGTGIRNTYQVIVKGKDKFGRMMNVWIHPGEVYVTPNATKCTIYYNGEPLEAKNKPLVYTASQSVEFDVVTEEGCNLDANNVVVKETSSGKSFAIPPEVKYVSDNHYKVIVSYDSDKGYFPDFSINAVATDMEDVNLTVNYNSACSEVTLNGEEVTSGEVITFKPTYEKLYFTVETVDEIELKPSDIAVTPSEGVKNILVEQVGQDFLFNVTITMDGVKSYSEDMTINIEPDNVVMIPTYESEGGTQPRKITYQGKEITGDLQDFEYYIGTNVYEFDCVLEEGEWFKYLQAYCYTMEGQKIDLNPVYADNKITITIPTNVDLRHIAKIELDRLWIRYEYDVFVTANFDDSVIKNAKVLMKHDIPYTSYDLTNGVTIEDKADKSALGGAFVEAKFEFESDLALTQDCIKLVEVPEGTKITGWEVAGNKYTCILTGFKKSGTFNFVVNINAPEYAALDEETIASGGTFGNGETILDISEFVGTNSISFTFSPDSAHEGQEHTVTVVSISGSTLTLDDITETQYAADAGLISFNQEIPAGTKIVIKVLPTT